MNRQETDCPQNSDSFQNSSTNQVPFTSLNYLPIPVLNQNQRYFDDYNSVGFVSQHQMLRDIKDSLSNIRRDTINGVNSHVSLNSERVSRSNLNYQNAKCEFMQIKPEFMNISSAAVNASGGGGGGVGSGNAPLEGTTPRGNSGNGTVKSTRNGYREKALREIRNSLKPFAHCDRSVSSASSTTSESSYPNLGSVLSHHGAGSSNSATSASGGSHGIASSGSSSGLPSSPCTTPNGLADRDLNLQRQVLKQLIAMGYKEDVACRILRLSAVKDDLLVDSAPTNSHNLQPELGNPKSPMEGINGLPGSPPPPPIPIGLKPLRKGSLQENVTQNSFVWNSRGAVPSSAHSQMDCGSSNTSVRSDSPGMINCLPNLQRPLTGGMGSGPTAVSPTVDGGNLTSNHVPFFRMQSPGPSYIPSSEPPPLPNIN